MIQRSVSPIDRSGTTSGTISTSTTLMAARSGRRGFSVQNQHGSAAIYINELGAAAVAGQPSIVIPAGATYTTPTGMASEQAVTVLSATASVPYAAREW